jgi:hypothetical protein
LFERRLSPDRLLPNFSFVPKKLLLGESFRSKAGNAIEQPFWLKAEASRKQSYE